MTLPRPRNRAGADGLDRLTAAPGTALLAFDFDGTLAPIVADPDDARAHPDAVSELARLSPRVGRLAVVTGRPARTAVDYGGLAGIGGVTVLGQYGRERWDGGAVTTPAPPPGVEGVRGELPGLLERVGAPEGTSVEDKGQALAVHTRNAAGPEATLALVRPSLEELAQRHGLVVEPGRLVLELRPPGMDKGAALEPLVREWGATAVLYAGDDLADLAAFDAVDHLRSHGVPGVTVCSGSQEVDALAGRADIVVDGPAGVAGLLSDLRAALPEGPPVSG